MSKNNLVLSSKKRCISFEDNNIFFDERVFCSIDLETFKKKIKHIVAENILDDRKIRVDSFKSCDYIYQSVIKDLSKNLNKINEVDWCVNSWSIVLGGWLRRFIYIIFYKFNILKNILSKYHIDNVYLANSSTNELTSHESAFIHDLSIDDDWNHLLNSKIFSYISANKYINKKYIDIDKKNFYEKKTFFEKVNNNKDLLKKAAKDIFSMLKVLSSKNDSLILNSYLPLVKEKQLELLFFQIPKFFKLQKINYKRYDQKIREKLNIKKRCLHVEKIVRDYIPTYLPTYVLENFKEVLSASKKVGYPLSPKFIFTSNSFEHNELFKFYVAEIKNTNKNVKYFIGQHGGAYITQIDNNYSNEVLTCDYFLSWGEKKFNHVNTLPLFNLKLPKKRNKRKREFISLIFRSLGYQCVPYSRISEGKKEFILANSFLENLPENLKNFIYLKFHDTFYERPNNFLHHLIDYKIYKNCEFMNYKEVIEQSKIVCFCYDSTGFLENISSQIPSVCLYPDIFNKLNEDCIVYYQDLKNAKIIFDNEKDLITHLQNIWPDVDAWWESENVQNQIKKTIKLFSNYSGKYPLLTIKKLISEKLN